MAISYDRCTLYHLSEERHAISGFFYKTSRGVLVDSERVIPPITQRYSVRSDMSAMKDPWVVGRMLEEHGQATIIRLGDTVISAFSTRNFNACSMAASATNSNSFNFSRANADGAVRTCISMIGYVDNTTTRSKVIQISAISR